MKIVECVMKFYNIWFDFFLKYSLTTLYFSNQLILSSFGFLFFGQICELKLSPPPLLNSHQGSVCFSISDWHGKRLLEDSVLDVRRSQGNGDGQIVIKLDSCIPLSGDIQVQFKYKGVIKKDKLFHFWFNTHFVNEETEGQIDIQFFFLFF